MNGNEKSWCIEEIAQKILRDLFFLETEMRLKKITALLRSENLSLKPLLGRKDQKQAQTAAWWGSDLLDKRCGSCILGSILLLKRNDECKYLPGL